MRFRLNGILGVRPAVDGIVWLCGLGLDLRWLGKLAGIFKRNLNLDIINEVYGFIGIGLRILLGSEMIGDSFWVLWLDGVEYEFFERLGEMVIGLCKDV